MKRFSTLVLPAAFVAAAGLTTPQPGFACAACYADPAGPMAQSMNLAILTLLGITVAVLGGFVWFFVSLARKSAGASALVAASSGRRMRERGTAPHLHPTEPPRGGSPTRTASFSRPKFRRRD